jgi:hypothetical protein
LIRDNIYTQLAQKYNKDVRFIRRITHHPFDFLHQKITDPDDHRPIRFRYVGVFFVKPYWKKVMINTRKDLPEDDRIIYARAPEKRFNKEYINLKKGLYKDGFFTSDDGTVRCFISDVQKWRYADTIIE